ncbi:A subunit of glutamyl-tRNA amidotransferase [Saccharata proteae CBS 121410]|uniref:Glutamyl-tRNA(Gln) amidotransferase subunit A, mitochondrial n=1 Tax=Saccharata proteae CBS 121410 TaxID=1314787 RepID=A0A9P4HR89_9PEZI|nr:A subunit of glutamyl-tRNA amidotransferase [Saccharata proteae CBS 121410]
MSLLREAERFLANQASRASLNAFISRPSAESVLRQVQDAEAREEAEKGPLTGRLIAIKDNICTTTLPTTAASRLLSNYTSPYSATAVSQLLAAGAILAGKTNLDEFGMGSHNHNSFFGPVTQESQHANPRSAGGSSGGSAVAISTSQCWAALGTDTGGSVRLPAAYTGTVGFKPSYGLISRWGVLAYANSLDTVGVMASSVGVAQAVTAVIAATHDPKDPTSLLPSTRARIAEQQARIREQRRGEGGKLRIGIPIDYNIAELTPAVRSAWIRTLAELSSRGHTLHPVELPSTRLALAAYYVLAPAEASSNLAKYDGVRYGTRAEGPDADGENVLFARTRGQGFGEEVRRRVLLGAYTLSAEARDSYFIQAQRVRRVVQDEFDGVFRAGNVLREGKGEVVEEGVDVLVCPTATGAAPRMDEVRAMSEVEGYAGDVFTVPASLAGLPAVSVPVKAGEERRVAVEEDVHVGMQVIGQFGADEVVFEAARVIEEMQGYGEED